MLIKSSVEMLTKFEFLVFLIILFESVVTVRSDADAPIANDVQKNESALDSMADGSAASWTAIGIELRSLKTIIFDLQKSIKDQNRSLEERDITLQFKLQEEMTGLNKSVHDIGTGLWRRGIMNDLKTKQFAKVDAKFLRLGADSPLIPLVVADTYAENDGNFDLLNEYARSSQNDEIRFKVLSALWSRMEANKHTKHNQLLVFYHTLKAKISKFYGICYEIQQGAHILHREVILAVSKAPAATVISFLSNPDPDEKEKRKMDTILSDYDETIFSKIIEFVVDEIYKKEESKDKLIHIIFEKGRISQILSVLNKLLSKYFHLHIWYDSTPLKLAYNLRRLQKSDNYKQIVTESEETEILNWQFDLPFSVKFLYFTEDIVISNGEYGRFLTAEMGENQITLTMTEYSKTLTPFVNWHLNLTDIFHFEFSNDKFPGNYLTVEENRPCLKAKNGPNVNSIFEWKVDLAAGFDTPLSGRITFRNVETNQLLCMQRAKSDTGYEIVMRHEDNGDDCLWMVFGYPLGKDPIVRFRYDRSS